MQRIVKIDQMYCARNKRVLCPIGLIGIGFLVISVERTQPWGEPVEETRLSEGTSCSSCSECCC